MAYGLSHGKGAMNKTQATQATGGLSRTSKMPCASYGLPEQECILGSILKKVPGSVCEICYSRKGPSSWPATVAADYRRLAKVREALEGDAVPWIDGMQTLIRLDAKRQQTDPVFRWHNNGDIQSEEHLELINKTAEATPEVRHWLPTKERGMVSRWRQKAVQAKNLLIQISAPMVGQKAGAGHGSEVHLETPHEGSFECLAPKQDGKCADCRACWNPDVRIVSYLKH